MFQRSLIFFEGGEGEVKKFQLIKSFSYPRKRKINNKIKIIMFYYMYIYFQAFINQHLFLRIRRYIFNYFNQILLLTKYSCLIFMINWRKAKWNTVVFTYQTVPSQSFDQLSHQLQLILLKLTCLIRSKRNKHKKKKITKTIKSQSQFERYRLLKLFKWITSGKPVS